MSAQPVGFYCNVLSDGTVIPFPGYEGSYTDLRGFRGPCVFDVIDARDGQPAQIHARRSAEAARGTESNRLTAVINFAWLDWEYLNNSSVLVQQDQDSLVGLDSDSQPQQGTSGTGGQGSFPAITETTINSRQTLKLTDLAFYRWRGIEGDRSRLPYGTDNRPAPGVVTVTMDVRKRTYADEAWPATELTDTLHETLSIVVTVTASVPAGIPADYFPAGFTSAEIDSFAHAALTNEWLHTYHGSGNVDEAYYITNVAFTVA